MLILDNFIKLISKIELQILKYRLSRYDYGIVNRKISNKSSVFLSNIFHTKFKKNALISYLVSPFIENLNTSHSNYQECKLIADILSELGYNVDVINWDNDTFIPNIEYDLVIDNHNNLSRLNDFLPMKCYKIFHATSTHWLYQNFVEYKRHYDYFLKTGASIFPARLLPPSSNCEYADSISMFGDSFTQNTYGDYINKIYQVPMSVTCSIENISNRNYSLAKRKFIWLNSNGGLLKGLDIVIEVFNLLPDHELYICGDHFKDLKFTESFSKRNLISSNIKIMGWLDIEGDEFKTIISEAAWVIGNSFSEGGGGSILNCMAKGIIPIISRSCSISIENGIGFYIEKNTPEAIIELIKKITSLDNSQLNDMSKRALNFIAINHTKSNFKAKYKEYIINRLNSISSHHNDFR